ncbi:MAG: Zn-ribbon domain-containing protein [Methanocellales archaeon]|nr:Zn-ribbon domain-containing protein [Methanocellales archaeon]MDD3291742.1 Zn-ribbon domain-containing protein [Methanocellales archaeon]MDD5235092.1 Zn-ribbon domain-containing protein [Methanocellales archaeon]MDD5485230.1 Zn-ribbon domain-containing protein [Methanocellales archaeon]
MPHKCTRCGQLFRDGSQEILSGCPSCGWNKFLYVMGEEQALPKASTIDELISKVEVGEKSEVPTEDIPSPEPIKRIESIKILGPGSYELNIKTLLDRKEIIMALKENGTYVVHLPSIFGKSVKKPKKRSI